MKVAKFGGSSLAEAAQFRKVADTVHADPERRYIVASAPGKRSSNDIKITDMLYNCDRLTSQKQPIDGGMTDNLRYTLYQSKYTVLPASRMTEPADFVCTIAGCCCENGDLIQEGVSLPELKRGDLLAVLTTGAYNYSMASHYNRVPCSPIVLLGEQGPYVAVCRESFDDLPHCDQ